MSGFPTIQALSYKRKKGFECQRNLLIPAEGPQSGLRALPVW
jgi:hypothetical protein